MKNKEISYVIKTQINIDRLFRFINKFNSTIDLSFLVSALCFSAKIAI